MPDYIAMRHTPESVKAIGINEFLKSVAARLDYVVNNRRDYPNVGDLKAVMRGTRDELREIARCL